MIIDAHAHIYPEKISEAAVHGIEDFYDMHVANNGTLKNLLALGEKSGIDKFLVHSVATVPAQAPSINNFLAASLAEHPGKLIGFMAMHPGYEDISGEIDRAISLGMQGIKLHPDFQQFAIDDPIAYPIYEAAEGRLPILFHMGDTRYSFSEPHRLAKMLKDFPNLRVIGAHFGGWSQWDEAAEQLAGRENLWVDSSSTSYAVPPERFRQLIEAFGTDRVLFASDYPMWSPGEELNFLRGLGFSQEDMERMLHKNLEDLLSGNA